MSNQSEQGERPQLSGDDRAELRLSYQDALDNIRWAKQQQWRVAYYVLLVYAAIIGYAVLTIDDQSALNWRESPPSIVLIILSILIALVGAWFLCSYQAFMRQERTRLHRIRNRHFCDAFYETTFEKPDHLNFLHHGELLITFATAAIIGTDFVIWLLSKDWTLLLGATLGMVILIVGISVYKATRLLPDWSRS